ncbi:MAG: hypothetical protein ACYCOU_08580, partial [Sulfobacillus sp.]
MSKIVSYLASHSECLKPYIVFSEHYLGAARSGQQYRKWMKEEFKGSTGPAFERQVVRKPVRLSN